MNKIPLSVIILTRNEAKYIERAIRSVAFAQEILVVDASSTDATRDIAAGLGARVVERAWPGFREQRNFALREAKQEWVFSLDADEAATLELAQWLQDFFTKGREHEPINGYKIRRVEYFLGKEIKGACWNPSYQDRLFRREKALYVGEIHEYPEVEGGFIRAPHNACILHSPHITVESFLEKMNRYTTLEAWDRYRQGERTGLAHMAVTFFSTWWKNFFYYRGYQDGVHGFVICLLEAVSRTVRHIKLWQIQRLKADQREDLLLRPEQALEAGALLHRELESGNKK